MHGTPDEKTKIGEDVTAKILGRVQIDTKKTPQKPLSCSVILKSYPPSTGQQWGELESYTEGKSRRITVKSINDYIERRLAAEAVRRGRATSYGDDQSRP